MDTSTRLVGEFGVDLAADDRTVQRKLSIEIACDEGPQRVPTFATEERLEFDAWKTSVAVDQTSFVLTMRTPTQSHITNTERRTIEGVNPALLTGNEIKIQISSFPAVIRVNASSGLISLLSPSTSLELNDSIAVVPRSLPPTVEGSTTPAVHKILPGTNIALRSCHNLKFVGYCGFWLMADQNVARKEQIFSVVRLPFRGDGFALRSLASGGYLSFARYPYADLHGIMLAGRMAEAVGMTECFVEEEVGGKTVLRCGAGDEYLYVFKDNKVNRQCLSTDSIARSQFDIIQADHIF
ncbi:hypothetical protein R1flu_028673 [Riccia fluitans]|uniref:Uncharacterized protein n=1 Tax=Riccia fluitans TaxID=41844 RepID=A0ABD1XMC9_9MARC